ncbi:lytic transglycosylase domain-containing protein [Sphingobacterium bovistauri]|uniref:Lytic transglycosylase domain-containing protein n=1 Tax=Sphingobacterium bovistauri TaxID=2781959 RepID=A0ABS7Z7P2_9SPHI|nr:lytic transglycosylase domain-containing protein [Sphingobacterium bovistauri]MCA5006170.1 lytic transglycosylase domain-containing protein [Sphingobacterium bovistauri]
MIKKRVMCFTAILSIMVLSKLHSEPQGISVENPYKKMMLEHAARLKEESRSSKNNIKTYYSSLTFANESVPTEDVNVKSKLGKYLARFSFKKTRSHKMHAKADKYLPKIEKILKSYGIPEDFKYIPIVESGLDPSVHSHKGAGGYWQFMPATARLYGLRVNGKVDERKDFVKSTHAAAKYIKSLYNEFGDWTLVAAAYNVGGGSLRGSIRRQKKDDYYQLRLNNETGSYVYKIISVKEVIENPSMYGYSI